MEATNKVTGSKEAWAEKKFDGPFEDSGFTWAEIDDALRFGLYGLPGGSSLAEFLEERGMVDE